MFGDSAYRRASIEMLEYIKVLNKTLPIPRLSDLREMPSNELFDKWGEMCKQCTINRQDLTTDLIAIWGAKLLIYDGQYEFENGECRVFTRDSDTHIVVKVNDLNQDIFEVIDPFVFQPSEAMYNVDKKWLLEELSSFDEFTRIFKNKLRGE